MNGWMGISVFWWVVTYSQIPFSSLYMYRHCYQILATSMRAFQRRVAAHIKANGGPVTSREELPPGMQRELEEVR